MQPVRSDLAPSSHNEQPIQDLVNLVPAERQAILGESVEEARERLLASDPVEVGRIRGSFALVARDGIEVRLARSLDRPLRYFLAKQEAGPLLVVAERIDQIRDFLAERGMEGQFHPSYTRMVPAHHVVTLRLVGCPDPNPRYERFLPMPKAGEKLPADRDQLGRLYVEALYRECSEWLEAQEARSGPGAPIGVLFSGGLDSGSVFLALYRALLDRGDSPARLKAFTLAVAGAGPEAGQDASQAREFLRRLDLELFLEEVEVPAERLDPLAAVEVIEDYKPLDVECATVTLALLEEIRSRYPEWRLLADGDGGDENLKDYPIEENPELTIRSVVNNPLLYQEGWGVDCVKHSLTYSGGLSRGCVRGAAPLARFGFSGFSPFTRPALVALAAAMPFGELAAGDHETLYALKGELLASGVRQVLGLELPVFEKRRFQHGAVPQETFAQVFSGDREHYRRHFLGLFDRPAA
jgi:asparagine synthase (glutamine-hydrolysing)